MKWYSIELIKKESIPSLRALTPLTEERSESYEDLQGLTALGFQDPFEVAR